MIVDTEFRIFDPRVIVLRPFEYDRLAFEHFRMCRVGKEAFAERLIDHADLHHRAIEQVARQHHVAGCFPEGLVVGANHLAVRFCNHRKILFQRAARDGTHTAVQLAGCKQLTHHGGHAARAMERLAEEAPRRLAVHQKRYVRTEALPVIERVLDTHMTRNRDHVNRTVRRCAKRGRCHDRVFERTLGHDVGRAQILDDHVDDPLAGLIRDPAAFTMGRRNRSAVRQRHAKRLGE